MLTTVRALLPHVFRASRKAPPVLCGVLALVLAVLPLAVSYRMEIPYAVTLIRVVSVTVALGVAFALDDPASPTTQVTPTSNLLVRLTRIALSALPLVAVWLGALLLCRAAVPAEARPYLPVGGLALEATALLVTTLAFAAVAVRVSAPTHGGLAAMPGLLLATTAVTLLPDDVQPFAGPGSTRWDASRWFWLVLLVGAVVVLASLLGEAGHRRRRRSPAVAGPAAEQVPATAEHEARSRRSVA
ncbi:hypothetical protein [Micromonospora sp. CV4]|uniref:hypothetical protein n=1 Tax=Micromonospora sp. CV4 TaxID=2478711 RepID=UPI001F37383B|nr:hypothetical protein [Micromonospora sp. CV4]